MPAPWFNRCQPRRGVFRGRFAPGAPATLAAVLGVLVLVSLGLWQLERAAWKNALIARIHARIAAPTVSLPADLGGPGTAGDTDPAAYEYRHVSVTGRFLNDHELFLVARSRYGNDGLEIVTPLVRADGGGVVLVNRGWVPKERRAPGSRSAGRQDGTVTIEGIARMPPRRVWFLPDNRPDLNQWLFMDPPAMAAAAGIDPATSLSPVFVDAGPAYNPGGLPVGGQTVIDPPNDHLRYALTWFGLAAALIVIYIVCYWHRER